MDAAQPNTTPKSTGSALKDITIIEMSHNALANEIEWLHDVISTLESRLTPIKVSYPAPDSETSLETHGQSQVVQRVDSFAQTVRNAKLRLQQVINELEV